jgi:hypothetical protein
MFLRDLVDADVNCRAYASLPALVNQARGYKTCNKLALRNSFLSTRSQRAAAGSDGICADVRILNAAWGRFRRTLYFDLLILGLFA